MTLDINYEEGAQERAQGKISEEISLIVGLIQKLLSDELGERSTARDQIPDWIRSYLTVGYGESDWLYDHIKKVDEIKVDVSNANVGVYQSVRAKIRFYSGGVLYPYEYRLGFWLHGSKSVSYGRIKPN